MKLPKKAIYLGVFAVYVVLAIIFIPKYGPGLFPKTVISPTPSASPSTVMLKMTPSSTSVKVGEITEVAVYLSGPNAQNVSVAELKFNFNDSELNLISATPGDFFNPSLKIMWDEKDSRFSLSKNPESENKADINSPILNLKLKALKTGSMIKLLLDPSSTVYISNQGGEKPNSQPVSYTVSD